MERNPLAAECGAGTTSALRPDRWGSTVEDTVAYLWFALGLPACALNSLALPRFAHVYQSSFKLDHIAQAAIGTSALAAALVDSLRSSLPFKTVTVPSEHACVEYKSESHYTLDGERPAASLVPIGGLHETSDGHVRVHDALPNHRDGTLRLLGLDPGATRAQVGAAIRTRTNLELEHAAHQHNVAIYGLRPYSEWDVLPQARVLLDCPISLRRLDSAGRPGLPEHMLRNQDRCLRGLRVLELSRVIAAPVAGRTLAAHGADVLWVTSPHLPDLPALDRDTSRGKRSIHLDLDNDADKAKLRDLIRTCDVFLQSYRPGALGKRGFGPAELAALKPGIIYANLSAFGTAGPWAGHRGFDSLVQTCSGMNVSEAASSGNVDGQVARPLPCQALDNTSGYFLATGIAAAVYKRAVEGGAWQIDVSLAGTMKFLRSLGQVTPSNDDLLAEGEVPRHYFEEHESAFGTLRAVKHSASIEGAMPGWDSMARPLGSDEPEWL